LPLGAIGPSVPLNAAYSRGRMPQPSSYESGLLLPRASWGTHPLGEFPNPRQAIRLLSRPINNTHAAYWTSFSLNRLRMIAGCFWRRCRWLRTALIISPFLVGRPALAQRIGLDILIEQLVRVELGAVAGSNIKRSRCALACTNLLTMPNFCTGWPSTIRQTLDLLEQSTQELHEERAFILERSQRAFARSRTGLFSPCTRAASLRHAASHRQHTCRRKCTCVARSSLRH